MHCVLDTSQPKPVLLCKCCGNTAPFSLPMTVSQMAAIVRQFQADHKTCPEKK